MGLVQPGMDCPGTIPALALNKMNAFRDGGFAINSNCETL